MIMMMMAVVVVVVHDDDDDDDDDDEARMMGCGTSKTSVNAARVHINGQYSLAHVELAIIC